LALPLLMLLFQNSLLKPNYHLKHFLNFCLYLSKPEIEKKIRDMRKMMEKAAKELDFMQAAKLRDDIKALQDKL
uniref:UvrB/UvrC motif-containing protein n=1 Tax=Flavobacterium sp. TaxID=239 RepID=UPI0040480C0E